MSLVPGTMLYESLEGSGLFQFCSKYFGGKLGIILSPVLRGSVLAHVD
jgi:hypothetical protein